MGVHGCTTLWPSLQDWRQGRHLWGVHGVSGKQKRCFCEGGMRQSMGRGREGAARAARRQGQGQTHQTSKQRGFDTYSSCPSFGAYFPSAQVSHALRCTSAFWDLPRSQSTQPRLASGVSRDMPWPGAHSGWAAHCVSRWLNRCMYSLAGHGSQVPLVLGDWPCINSPGPQRMCHLHSSS